jgi:hypothetical protein
MATINTRLLPFRDYDEHEVYGFFALNDTGVAGTFVSAVTYNPDNQDGWSNTAPGAEYNNILSLRYESKAKAAPAASGAAKWNVLGVTLKSTLEFDENGEKLLFHKEKCDKLQAVVSGEPVPILKRGLVTLTSDAYVGTPTPGFVGVIEGAGIIRAVNPSVLSPTGTYTPDQVVGRFISTSGSNFGGYALFDVQL